MSLPPLRYWIQTRAIFYLQLLLVSILMAFMSSSRAQPWKQTPSDNHFLQSNTQIVYQAIDAYLADYTKTLQGETSYEIGTIDSRMVLRPCAQPMVSIYRGAKPWGRTRVGVSCTSPATWTIQVPVHIRVYGEYPVAAKPLDAGDIMKESDIAIQKGELSELPRHIETDVKQIIGKRLSIGLANGQPFRRHFLKSPELVKRGQTVKIIYIGNGFSVTNSGEALASGGPNDMIGVRLSSGTIIKGVIQESGVVKIQ